MPTPPEIAKLPKNCSALDLYYGNGADHLQKALVCGLAGWARMGATSNPGNENHLDDETNFSALAMLFANGEGVHANLPLAEHFACESGDFIDTNTVLGVIAANQKLDICSASYGSKSDFYCLPLNRDRTAAQLKAEEANVKRVLPSRILTDFVKLDEARTAFLTAHSFEQPAVNAGQERESITESNDADRVWLRALTAIEAGSPPPGVMDAADFSSADADLNAAFKTALTSTTQNCPATPPSGDPPCVSPAIVRTAQRAWLRYREAWVQMGAARWPEVSADKWRSWLTVERIGELGDR
jgi:hypothetical protein